MPQARKLIGLPNAYAVVTPARRRLDPAASPTATAVHQLLACAIAEELAEDADELRSFYDRAVSKRGLPDHDLKVIGREGGPGGGGGGKRRFFFSPSSIFLAVFSCDGEGEGEGQSLWCRLARIPDSRAD